MAFAGARLAQLEYAGTALALWSLQIALNALWTPVFFGLRKIKSALYVIVGLWVEVAVCVVVFFAHSWVIGLVFAPYLLWVSIALMLNLSVYKLNPDR